MYNAEEEDGVQGGVFPPRYYRKSRENTQLI